MFEAPFRRSAEPAFHRTTRSAAVATRPVRICGAGQQKYGLAAKRFKPLRRKAATGGQARLIPMLEEKLE